MRGVGAHQGLAPVADVARDARWGRIEETLGEDPYLVGAMVTRLRARPAGRRPRQRGSSPRSSTSPATRSARRAGTSRPHTSAAARWPTSSSLPFEMAVKAGARRVGDEQLPGGRRRATGGVTLATHRDPARHVGLRRLRGRRLRRGDVPPPVRGRGRGRARRRSHGAARRARRGAARHRWSSRRACRRRSTRAAVDRRSSIAP